MRRRRDVDGRDVGGRDASGTDASDSGRCRCRCLCHDARGCRRRRLLPPSRRRQPHSKGGWTAGAPRSEGGGEGFAGGLGDLKAADARDTFTRNGTHVGILLVVPSALLYSQSFHLQASWRARLFLKHARPAVGQPEVADCLLFALLCGASEGGGEWVAWVARSDSEVSCRSVPCALVV